MPRCCREESTAIWALIHRPMTTTGAHMWISYSPDLRHWGSHKVILEARRGGWWDANKIGLCSPPIETPKGWLVIYHGVRAPPREASIASASRSSILTILRSACNAETHGSLVPKLHTSASEMCVTLSFPAAKPSPPMETPSTSITEQPIRALLWPREASVVCSHGSMRIPSRESAPGFEVRSWLRFDAGDWLLATGACRESEVRNEDRTKCIAR